jgi:hypothetical protein
MYSKIIGKILLKEKEIILNIYNSLKFIYVVLDLKILIFSIQDLELLYVIEDIYKSELISASILFNPGIIAYVSNLNPSYIKIDKFLYENNPLNLNDFNDNDNEIKSHHQMILVTGFKEIDYIKVSNFGEYICVIDKGVNMIHLYSLFDYELVYCLYRGDKVSKTINVAFDLKCKFMSVLTELKTLHIYKLYEHESQFHYNYLNKKIVENANINRMSLKNIDGDLTSFLLKNNSAVIKTKVFLYFFSIFLHKNFRN